MAVCTESYLDVLTGRSSAILGATRTMCVDVEEFWMYFFFHKTLVYTLYMPPSIAQKSQFVKGKPVITL